MSATPPTPPSGALHPVRISAAHSAASKAAASGRGETLRMVRWTLRLGIVAAACGITTWRVGESRIDVLAAVAVVAFGASIWCTHRLSANRYEERWYRGRAIAESVKSMAWSFSAGGEPYPSDDPESTKRFLQRIGELIRDNADVLSEPDHTDQITDFMSATRAAVPTVRREIYLRERVDRQLTWYRDRSAENERSARRWSTLAIIANACGMAGALVKLLDAVDVDLLGLAATLGAGATAWTQVRQHRALAASYHATALDLSVARSQLEHAAGERDWAAEVRNTESAISREHTMWLARRGRSQP